MLCEDFDAFDFTTLSVDAVTLIGALVHVPKDRFPATLARILQALKPGGHVLLTMKQGEGTSTAGDGRVFDRVGVQGLPGGSEGTSTAGDGRVFVLWRIEELRGVLGNLGLAVVRAFTNASVLGTGEMWLGYVAENRLRKTLGQDLALLAH